MAGFLSPAERPVPDASLSGNQGRAALHDRPAHVHALGRESHHPHRRVLLIEDKKSAIIYTSDTGPTERIWEVANQRKNLKAIITEASFPNEEEERAELSGHMTPELLKRDLLKLKRRVRILIAHVKPSHSSRIARQLRSLGVARIELVQQGKSYRF